MNSQITNAEHVRQRFRAFVNDDAIFRTFIQTCNTKSRERGRLTYSQEQLWTSFVGSHSEFESLAIAEILDIFHVCHIHFKLLHAVNVPIRKDVVSISRTREAETLISQEAFYAIPFMPHSPAWGEASFLSVDHCEDCVSRRKQIEA